MGNRKYGLFLCVFLLIFGCQNTVGSKDDNLDNDPGPTQGVGGSGSVTISGGYNQEEVKYSINSANTNDKPLYDNSWPFFGTDSANYEIFYYVNDQGYPMLDKGCTTIKLRKFLGSKTGIYTQSLDHYSLIVYIHFEGVSVGLYKYEGNKGSYDNHVTIVNYGPWYYTDNTRCEILVTKFDKKEIAGTFTGCLISGSNIIDVEGDFLVPRE